MMIYLELMLFFCIKINVIFSPNANKSEVEIHLFRNRLPSVSTMSSFLALYKKRDHCLGSVNRIVYEINYTYPWTVIKSLQFISTNTRKILADRRLSLVEFCGSVLFPITQKLTKPSAFQVRLVTVANDVEQSSLKFKFNQLFKTE